MLALLQLRRAGWEHHRDDATGRGYYFHRQSGHSQWEPPPLAETHAFDSGE